MVGTDDGWQGGNPCFCCGHFGRLPLKERLKNDSTNNEKDKIIPKVGRFD